MFLETLKNYLEFNNSCVRTSKAMFMHVNSVKYRMKHVEEKILVDLNTMNGRSAAWIALKLYYYLKNKTYELNYEYIIFLEDEYYEIRPEK